MNCLEFQKESNLGMLSLVFYLNLLMFVFKVMIIRLVKMITPWLNGLLILQTQSGWRVSIGGHNLNVWAVFSVSELCWNIWIHFPLNSKSVDSCILSNSFFACWHWDIPPAYVSKMNIVLLAWAPLPELSLLMNF